MLDGTPAADAKVLTLWRDALNALTVPGDCRSFGIAGFIARQCNVNTFAKQCVFHEDDLALVPGQALAVEIDRLNREIRENLGNLWSATFHLQVCQCRCSSEITLPMRSAQRAVRITNHRL